MLALTSRKLNNSIKEDIRNPLRCLLMNTSQKAACVQTMHLHRAQNAPGWVHRLKSTDLNRLHCINFGRTTDMSKPKIAFICTHNSCRSQIAEALGKHFLNDKFEPYSAVRILAEHLTITGDCPTRQENQMRFLSRLYGKLKIKSWN